MSETSEPRTEPVTPATAPSHEEARRETVVVPKERNTSRVTQAAAVVGIVAGVVFIVAVIFFSGFILGKQSGGGFGHSGGPRPNHEMIFRQGPPPGPPMMWPGQGPGRAESGPGPGPGPAQSETGAGPRQPGQPPTPPEPPARP